MYESRHDTKVAIVEASEQQWCRDCLVISEADANTIWIFEVAQVTSPLMRTVATIANQAIDKMIDND